MVIDVSYFGSPDICDSGPCALLTVSEIEEDHQAQEDNRIQQQP